MSIKGFRPKSVSVLPGRDLAGQDRTLSAIDKLDLDLTDKAFTAGATLESRKDFTYPCARLRDPAPRCVEKGDPVAMRHLLAAASRHGLLPLPTADALERATQQGQLEIASWARALIEGGGDLGQVAPVADAMVFSVAQADRPVAANWAVEAARGSIESACASAPAILTGAAARGRRR